MTDDVQQPIADPAVAQPLAAQPVDPTQSVSDGSSTQSPAEDPLASLEDLLNKAKAKRSSAGQDRASGSDHTQPEIPAGPTPEEIAAQEQAKQAEQQSQLAQQEQAAEVDRQHQLEEQRQKMANELQNTPEYQARQQQNQEEAKKEEEKKAEQEGFVIHQIGDDKV